MGREIRRVQPMWEHPKKEDGRYQPMHDEDFDTNLKEWLEGYELWKKDEHPDQLDCPYWEWEGAPPDPEYYRPAFTTDPTWYQVYETVSEGTPVSPPFETKEELVDYLVENGDFWDQQRGHGGWSRGNAEGFIERQWAPSGIFIRSGGETTVKAPRDGA